MKDKIKGFIKQFHEIELLVFSSIFLAFTFFFFAPVSIYLSNSDEFWFNLYQIFGMIFGVSISFLFIMILVGWVLNIISERLFFVYETLILAGGICTYIHSNFLNMKVGTFDGGDIDWSKFQGKMIVNLICWIGIVAIVFAIRILLKKTHCNVRKVFADILDFFGNGCACCSPCYKYCKWRNCLG